MTRPVPAFPLVEPLEDWDDLTLLAANVFCEAEGEPVEGKVGVAWVVRNRADRWKRSLNSIILQPYQFSWLSEDERPKHTARLTVAEGPAVEQCWRAAAGALWRLLPDPTGGALHYLNVEATRRGRKEHDLPAWADLTKTTAILGRHHFLRLA